MPFDLNNFALMDWQELELKKMSQHHLSLFRPSLSFLPFASLPILNANDGIKEKHFNNEKYFVKIFSQEKELRSRHFLRI